MDTVEIVVEVPDEKVAFMLELLESIRFVSNPRIVQEAEAVDDTAKSEASTSTEPADLPEN